MDASKNLYLLLPVKSLRSNVGRRTSGKRKE
jgi:hypothetical protein